MSENPCADRFAGENFFTGQRYGGVPVMEGCTACHHALIVHEMDKDGQPSGPCVLCQITRDAAVTRRTG